MKSGNFKISVKSSSLSREEKRKLLWDCFDILFSNLKKDNKHKTKNEQRKPRTI
jgi:hypothetical protein